MTFIEIDACVTFMGISQSVVVCNIRCHPWGNEMLVSRPRTGNARVLSPAISVLGLSPQSLSPPQGGRL